MSSRPGTTASIPPTWAPAMARDIAGPGFGGTSAYVVDPPVVDELDEVSRVTGLPGVERRAAWHALNQKAVAKRFADERGWEYEQLNLIVAHLGAESAWVRTGAVAACSCATPCMMDR